MPDPRRVDPKTGKRYNYVDPKKPPVDAKREELQALERQEAIMARQEAALAARESLLAYTRFTMPDPEAPHDMSRSLYDARPFHIAVASALEKVEKGEVQQLIFCMPPRHGKTELATKRLAAWISGRHPNWDIIVATYSDDKAWEFGGDTRAILTSPQHRQVFPGYALRRGSTAKDFMQTTAGGKILFKGRGGALTGSGMHIGLGDDLFKDDQEAQSKTIRDQAWAWFTKVFMTRRMGPKLVILTMTRWHSDDIIGRLTDPENPAYNEQVAKRWRIIRFPAIAEDDDVLGRPKGEPLWPERYGLDYLEEQRGMDPLGFEALFQQNPTVADGTLFKRENVRYYRTGPSGGGVRELPSDLRIYCASDHAVGTGQRNDPTCMVKVGVDQYGNIYILDVFWQRVATDVAIEAMLAMGGGDKPPLLWWAERGHITKSIGPALHKAMEDARTWINIREVTPANDKEQRAQSIAARFGQGKVFFPQGAWWVEKAISELMAFPNGIHDDFVDALAYIGLGLRSQVYASPPKERPAEPAFGSLGWVKRQSKWDDEQAARRAAGGF